MTYYDIVGFLPLELLIYVVEHLNLEDVLRSQRVSKRWRAIFSCDTIIKPFLREALASLGLEGMGVDAVVADAMSYLRWQFGLQHARPFRKIYLPWPTKLPGDPCQIQCHSRRLCYVIPGRNEVEMVNLETRERSIWTDGGTGEYNRLSLSNRYLVVSLINRELNYLTAWDIHTTQRFRQRIALKCPHPYKIIDDKVVISNDASIYVWDLSLNHVQKIGSFSRLWLYHVDAAKNILVAFEIDWSEEQPEVQETKWVTTTGDLLEKKTFYLSFPAGQPAKWNYDKGFDPYHTFGYKTVTNLFLEIATPAATFLEYDYAVDQLTVRWIDCEAIYKEALCHGSAYPSRNLVYRYDSETCNVVIYNATTGTVTLHPVQFGPNRMNWARSSSISTPRGRATRDNYVPRYLRVFGDREVFGLANRSGVQLWFFNPNFAPDPRI